MIGYLCFGVFKLKRGRKKQLSRFTLIPSVSSTNSGHLSVQKCLWRGRGMIMKSNTY